MIEQKAKFYGKSKFLEKFTEKSKFRSKIDLMQFLE